MRPAPTPLMQIALRLRTWVRPGLVDILLLLALGLLPISWFRGDYLVNVSDFVLPIDRAKYFLATLFSWDSTVSMGYPAPQQLAGSIYYGLYGAITQWAGLSVSAYEKSLFFLWFAGAGLSMYYLCHVLRWPRLAKLTAAVFYMMNPFSMTVIWHVAHGTVQPPYAVAPLILGMYIAGLSQHRTLRYAAAMSLVWVITGFSVNPAMDIIHWLPVFGYLVYYLALHRNRAIMAQSLRFTASVLGLWLLLNAFWAIPFLTFLAEASKPWLPSLLDDFRTAQVNSATVWDALRLMGDWAIKGWYRGDSFYYYGTTLVSLPFVALSTLIPILVAAGILAKTRHGNAERLFFALLFLGALFLSKGLKPPLEFINEFIYLHIPYIGTAFRAVWQKWGMLLPLAMSPLLGLGILWLYGTLARGIGRRVSLILSGALATLLFGVLVFPFWTGDVLYPGGKALAPHRIKIPSQYPDAGAWVNSFPQFFRLFVVPLSKTSNYFYRWPAGYIGAAIDKWFFDKPVINSNSGVYDVPMLLGREIEKMSHDSVAAKIFGLLNVKYLLWAQDANWEDVRIHPQWFQQPPEVVASFIHDQDGLDIDRNFGNLSLVAVDDKYVQPHIYASTDPLIVFGDVENLLPLSFGSYLDYNPALFFAPQQQMVPGSKDKSPITDLVRHGNQALFAEDKLSDLVLEDVAPKYHYDSTKFDKVVHFTAKSNDVYAILGKAAREKPPEGSQVPESELPRKDSTTLRPVVGDVQLIEPNPDSEVTQLLRSSAQWRYFGNLALKPGDYSATLMRDVQEPLGYWSRLGSIGNEAEGQLETTLWQTVLPDFVPEKYTTKNGGGQVAVYLQGQPLRPTWGRWAGREELYEVGNQAPRQIVVNMPSDYFPTSPGFDPLKLKVAPGTKERGPFTFSYLLPGKIQDEVEEFIIVPISALQDNIQDIKQTMSQPQYRVSNMFSKGKESFYALQGGEYSVEAHVSPRVRPSPSYLLPQTTDWQQELGQWRVGPEAAIRGSVELPMVIYGQNFYNLETDEFRSWRWGSNNMELMVTNPQDQGLMAELEFSAVSIRERTLEVAVNGKLVSTLSVPAAYEPADISIMRQITAQFGGEALPRFQLRDYPPNPVPLRVPDIPLEPGVNRIVLHSPQGAQVMDEELANGDRRAVVMQVADNLRLKGTGHWDATPASAPKATRYAMSTVDGKLFVNLYLEGGAEVPEYVLMGRDLPAVDLERYPTFDLSYRITDPAVQSIDAFFGIDYTGDGKVDDYLYSTFPGSVDGAIKVDLLGQLRTRFWDRYYTEGSTFRLVKVILAPHKVWGLDVRNTGRTGLYGFELGNINFLSRASVFAPERTLPIADAEGIRKWTAAANNTTYETRFSDDRALVLSEYLDSQLLGVAPEQKEPFGMSIFVLKTGVPVTQLTGQVDSEDQDTITLKNVVELQGDSVTLRKDNISLRFSPRRTTKRELEKEWVTLSTRLDGIDLSKNPYLGIHFKVQAPNIQTIDLAVGIDANGDGLVDSHLTPGIREELKGWTYEGTFGAVDLYKAYLPENFPASYQTNGPTKERLTAFKDGKPLQVTWASWSFNEDLMEIGYAEPRTVIVNVPRGTVPTAKYVVSYLPEPQPSPLFDGYQFLEVNLAQAIRQAYPNAPQARPLELTLRLKRLDDADVSSPESRGTFTFNIKDIFLYQKYAYPLGEDLPKVLDAARTAGTTAFTIDGKGYQMEFSPQGDFSGTGQSWLATQGINLSPGLHKDAMEIVPNELFRVDFVELAQGQYKPRQPQAQVDFQEVNRTVYRVSVSAEEPFWLVFGESFHQGWRAYIQPEGEEGIMGWSVLWRRLTGLGSRTELKEHYVVNGFGNGWYVPQTGSYQISIEFWPQAIFEASALLSALTALTCLGLVLWPRRRISERRNLP